ncbi:MAG: hypothetical protein KA191_17215 [Verrucomicrobia bacterium]|nr:hypothetical protein [Verrucomicrobiota bacterium]NMD20656.1 hypothetical protein [Verrucomicrobiota bacterium]
MFSRESLLGSDPGLAPLTVVSVATSSQGGGTIADIGDGWYRYTPPAGPDAADLFTYALQRPMARRPPAPCASPSSPNRRARIRRRSRYCRGNRWACASSAFPDAPIASRAARR